MEISVDDRPFDDLAVSRVHLGGVQPALTPVRPAEAVQRGFDLLTAAILLLIALPLLAVIAVVVRCQGGPILFRQDRVGRAGRTIGVAKFRTMITDAEDLLRSDPSLQAAYVANGFKLPPGHDPRLTKVGRFLRASSLDELPQLWNVLRGDMSMVGPRPVVPPELVEYTARNAEAAYLSVRPGLTGLWQVSGRSNLCYDRRIALDLQYLERRSLLGDLAIVARTVPAVLKRVGAH